jgi:hypothetical protein
MIFVGSAMLDWVAGHFYFLIYANIYLLKIMVIY